MLGLLNINKPAGWTSRRVVDHVQRLVRPAKAGHAGTLDPLAAGVLVVCVGRATRLIPCVQEQLKTYRARFLLGRVSDTDDVTGNVRHVADLPLVSRARLEMLLPEFIGRIRQVPPQFSAVHVAGRRAYKLARAGESVQLEPREVDVFRIEILGYEFPQLDLEIECGSGTYIRAIGRDLGRRLGCGAVMSELVRTRIGAYSLETAVDIEQLDADNIAAALLPAATAVAHLPRIEVTAAEAAALLHGRSIPLPASSPGAERSAVFDADRRLICVAAAHIATGTLRPTLVFA
jgi:tRNA pseudouridine55 synthase